MDILCKYHKNLNQSNEWKIVLTLKAQFGNIFYYIFLDLKNIHLTIITFRNYILIFLEDMFKIFFNLKKKK
jgi:hypothetical protein